MLIKCLVKYITPNIILRRHLQSQYLLQKEAQGNEYISCIEERLALEETYKQLAYFVPDERRDQSTQDILTNRMIRSWELTGTTIFVFIISQSDNMKIFIVKVFPPLSACCQCSDFLVCDGTYKHIRVGILYINQLRIQPNDQELPEIILPTRIQAI